VKRDLISIGDLSRRIARRSSRSPKPEGGHACSAPASRLEGRTMAMNLREAEPARRASRSEIGIAQLGGTAVYLAPGDIRLGERESVTDIARNLSRWSTSSSPGRSPTTPCEASPRTPPCRS